MEGSLLCKNSVITGATMVEVDDTFGRKLSTSELDHVSKDGENSKQSSAIVLSYSHGHFDNKECFCPLSANHVSNLEDICNKVFIAKAHYNRCGETLVSMNNLGWSSEQGCETLEFAGETTGVEEVRGGEEVEKIYKLLKDHEGNKEKENGSERQGKIFHAFFFIDDFLLGIMMYACLCSLKPAEGYNDRIIWNCDLKKTSPVILRHESIIEDISNIASPASETPNKMNNSARLSMNIDRHDDHNVLYLAESISKKVGREECQVVVQKQIEDMKTLVDSCGESLAEKASVELDYLAETPKKPGNLVVTWPGFRCFYFISIPLP